MSRCLFLAVLAATVTGPALADDSALEPLMRRDQLFGWEAVGRLDLGNVSMCTGTLIAPDLVLTAAHCVWNGDKLFDPNDVVFQAGFTSGAVVAESRAVRLVVLPSYVNMTEVTEDNLEHDVALVQLERPILSNIAAPFEVAEPDHTAKVSVVSYGAGRSENLSWQKECAVEGRLGNLLAFSCDVTFGSSGAPVFDMSEGRARIVSIVSSIGTRGDETIAFGMRLPAIVAALKTELRAGRGAGTAAPKSSGARWIAAGDGSADTGARFLKPKP